MATGTSVMLVRVTTTCLRDTATDRGTDKKRSPSLLAHMRKSLHGIAIASKPCLQFRLEGAAFGVRPSSRGRVEDSCTSGVVERRTKRYKGEKGQQRKKGNKSREMGD